MFLLWKNKVYLAGVAGFEPADQGVKVPCLTAWRYPYIMWAIFNSFERPIAVAFTSGVQFQSREPSMDFHNLFRGRNRRAFGRLTELALRVFHGRGNYCLHNF